MKRIKLLIILLSVILTGTFIPSEAQVKITDGAVLTMDPNSLLELESTNKGLLIPRIAINSLILPAPLTAPVPAGMQVYSTGGTVSDGFYYWNGSKWQGYSISEIPITKSANTTLRTVTASQAFQFATVIHLQDAAKNDYFQLYCSTVNNGDVLTFQDINWYVSSQ